MTRHSEDVAEQVASAINAAWPCFVHYAAPQGLLGPNSRERIQWVLAQLKQAAPTRQRPLPAVVPAPDQITDEMARGHEHHPACLALAAALTRCIPSLTRAVAEGRWRPVEDQHAARHALVELHARYHALDPAPSDNDAALIEALADDRPDAAPEVGADWRWMVRLTEDYAMGAPLGAFDFMPMRCFAELAHARNWAAIQAWWDYKILGDPSDPAAGELVRAISQYDQPGEQTWCLPSTGVTLHIVPRDTPGA